MNILFLSTHLNYGGITSYLISLALSLQKKGNKVFIASSGGDARPALDRAGITCLTIPIRTKCEVSPGVLVSFLKLKKELKDSSIDIIHSHTRVTQVLGFFLAKALHAGFVSTCHGFFKLRFSRLVFPAWGQQVIAISQPVAEHLRRDFKIKPDNISVIHNGIDFERFKVVDIEEKKRIKKEFNLPADRLIVAMVARLSQVKGHTYFIQAMPDILKELPDTIFLIAGDGKLKESLVSQVEALKFSRSVFFLPIQGQTPRILSVIDCLVSPSLQEGLGLSIIEAQAAGVPVVAFAVGGIVSLIEDAKTGLLASPQDVRSLSAAVVRMLKDANLRHYIIKNAQENININFNVARMVEETLAVYSRIKGKCKQ
jgi:glycosyltransferase involved in cell wall biosynthesis